MRWGSKDHKLKYFDSATKVDDKAVIFIDELKKSVIEDLRKLIKKHNKLPAVNQSDEECYETGKIEGQMDYIKEKFNITDEDLKND